MTTTIGELTYKLGLDSSAFKDGMTAAHNQANESGGFFKRALEFATGGAILGGLSKLKDGFVNVAKGMIDGNAEFETYQTQFGVLLGSTDAAKKRLDELAKFGASTPFELPELVRADKVLTSFGIHSQDMLTIVGDVASGTGASFEDMALLMGKFSSGATGEAISRFQELGIATKDELRKMGIEFDKGGSMTTPVKDAMPILEKLMKDKFGGLMDAQSKTFSGMMSNMQDWVGQTLRTLGQPIFEVLKDKLQVVLAFLSSPEVVAAINQFAVILAGMIAQGIDGFNNLLIALQPVADFLITNLPPAIQTATNVWNTVLYPALQLIWNFITNNIKPLLASLAAVFLTVVVPALYAWAAASVTAAATTIAALLPVLLPLAAIGAAVFLLYKVWDSNFLGIRTALTNFWNNYGSPIFELLKTWLAENIPVAIQKLTNFWNTVLLPAITAIYTFIRDTLVPTLVSMATSTFNTVSSAITTLSGFWTGTLKPALDAVWSFLDKYVIPILKLLAEITIAALNLAIKALAGYWKDTLLPAITSVKTFISDTLVPAFNNLAGPIIDGVKNALSAIAKVWNETLKPALNALATFIKDTLGPVFSGFNPSDAISKFFSNLSKQASDLVAWLQKIKDWLDRLSGASVPTPSSRGSFAGNSLLGNTSGGNGGNVVIHNYNLGVTTAATAEGAINEFVHMQQRAKI
jgi:hypothetical protein